MIGKLSGYKTYIVAVLLIAGAIGGVLADKLTWMQAAEAILGALGMAFLRAGVKKSGPVENTVQNGTSPDKETALGRGRPVSGLDE